jgi:hypothetical protein
MASLKYPAYYTTANNSTGTVTISSTASLYSGLSQPITYNVSPAGTGWSTAHPSLTVSGESNFEGDVKIKGRSLEKLLDTIEKRLAILTPNPAKLEKFEALKKAYDHYKLLEALCHEDDKK